jgi:hypothetical protein
MAGKELPVARHRGLDKSNGASPLTSRSLRPPHTLSHTLSSGITIIIASTLLYTGLPPPMNKPMDHHSQRRSKDFLSPQASTGTLGSVTSHRSQRSASTRRHGNYLSTIPSRSEISVPSQPFSPPISPTVYPHPLSSTHVLSHHPYSPQHSPQHCHLHSHVTVDTAPDPSLFFRGPDHTGCASCGVDPAFLFPKHPWDIRRPWWEHLKREYDIVKPYLEWQRREKYITKQRRRREGKLKRQRFSPRALSKSWKVELERFG